jgi:hypothetical protein
MSSRPFLAPKLQNPIINGASMGASITGPATVIQMLPGISYDISWTGSPVGTFQIQVSNTYSVSPDGTVTTGNWTTIPSTVFSGSYPVPAGAPGNGMIDLVGTMAYAVRLVYTRTSGSGALTVVAASKVL